MTTTPTTGVTATPVTSIATEVKNDLAWVKAHIILLLLAAGLAWGSVYGVESLIAKHDAATAKRYELLLSAQETQTAALETRLQTDEAASAARDAAAQAAYAALAQGIIARDAKTSGAVKTAATLDATQTAAAITKETGGPATAVNDTIVLPLMTGRTVNEDLLAYDGLKLDYTDAQKQLDEQKIVLGDNATDINDLKALDASQTKQLADQAVACQAQIKSVKAADRKRLLKWTTIAGIVGFITGRVVKP